MGRSRLEITLLVCDLEDIEEYTVSVCCDYIPTDAGQSFSAGIHRDEYVEVNSIHS